jgi:hypothetical protein
MVTRDTTVCSRHTVSYLNRHRRFLKKASDMWSFTYSSLPPILLCGGVFRHRYVKTNICCLVFFGLWVTIDFCEHILIFLGIQSTLSILNLQLKVNISHAAGVTN